MLVKHTGRFNKQIMVWSFRDGTEKWIIEQVREGSVARRESSSLNAHCSKMNINIVSYYWA